MHVQFVSKTFVSNRSEKFELHSMAIVSRNFKYIFSKFTGGTSRQRPKPKQLLNYMAGEPVPALAIGSNSFKSFQIVWYRIGRNWKELEAIASFRSRFAGTRKKKVLESNIVPAPTALRGQLRKNCKHAVLALPPEYQVY